MHSLSILGTSSDAGKSTLSFALTYLIHRAGIKVAPFKAQNVSNNSQVCDSGGEIAIPQHFAAESIGIKTTCAMNPILIKSGGDSKAHLIVNGKSLKTQHVLEYYRDINQLKPLVKKAFLELKKEYDCIIAEGAGSPVELNLMDKDLSNITIAESFDTKIVLIADIERGGVFASIYGVVHLLPKQLRKNIVGIIINKFRGDITLFDEGVQIIENQFKIKVLGVVPYRPFNLGFEDSASLMNYTQDSSASIIKVGVIQLPHMSNFTDFEPLVADAETDLSFVDSSSALENCDLIILPGSKRVINDLAWLRGRGFEKQLQDKKRMVVAICGGYEMMFEKIEDPKGIESDLRIVEGLSRIKGSVVFEKKKIVKKGQYTLFGLKCKGYEIHNGRAEKIAVHKKNLYATFVHGLFDNNNFRRKLFKEINPKYKGFNFQKHKAKSIHNFAMHIDKHVDVDYIINTLQKN